MNKYRKLIIGDIIQEGDEFQIKNSNFEWLKSSGVGRIIDKDCVLDYRRLINKSNHPNTNIFR